MTTADAPTKKDRDESAKAIGICLTFLARDAANSGLEELSKLINVAALAAAEAGADVVN